ncbi:MAG: 3-dehydroquinate synthase [Syntrophobacterales bacterium]|nr:3-dehydroquinate synthase [Syntrophobacterales bacterium]
MRIIKVELSRSESYSYEIWCELGLRKKVRERLKEIAPGRRLFWIFDREVVKRWGEDFDLGPQELIVWEAREDRKNLASIEKLARELISLGADRLSLLVSVGGGVTGDVVGFLASIYMRGIPFVQVPTTLVAQVDSSIGGKTGVDLPDGKNLIGTFHQPMWVAIDPEFITSLPQNIMAQGMAEVIKTAWIGDEGLVEMLESQHDSIKAMELKVISYVVGRCAEIKASIVMQDERESDIRRILNLGHTFGHAIERASNYSISHGEAVAMGCICAAKLSFLLGKISEENLFRMVSLFTKYNLPVEIPPTLDTDDIIRSFYADKKKRDKMLVFVLPLTPGKVELYITDDLSIVKEAVSKKL